MTERLRYRELLGRLLSENAPLRVIDGDKLVSAPMSYFDSMLMSYVTDKWQKVAMVFIRVTISHWEMIFGKPTIRFWRLACVPWSKAAAWKFGAKPPATSFSAR